MTQARVNILSAVNSSKISKKGNTITIKDVVPIVDDIVMNSILYPAAEIDKGYMSLNGTAAPAGHPKDESGNYISAKNAEALQGYWIGAGVTNVKRKGGKVTCDVTINVDQANAMESGRELIARCDAAMNGEKIEPINVSTGLMLRKVQGNGESKGKEYTSIGTDFDFDHLAILLNEQGAGQPSDGVGLWLNQEGQREPVMMCNIEQEDLTVNKSVFAKMFARIFCNSELSNDEVREALQTLVGGYDSGRWVSEVYSKTFIYRESDRFYQSDYFIDSENVVQLLGNPVEVKREVEYEPIQEVNQMKEKITAALNAAGINSAGMSDDDCLAAYNAVQAKPLQDKLTAANERIATHEAEKQVAANAAKKVIADKLAVNSSLTADDFMLMSNERLAELDAKAAPIVIGNAADKKQETLYQLPE